MNKLYTYLFFLMAFLSPVGALADKGWIDLTSERIINPDFTNNKTNGWTISYRQGTNNTRCEAMEFWNSTFNISQNLMNMPAGRYRMSVQSYFRCKDNNNGYQDYLNGTEDITGYLFAGNASQKLVSIYSQSFQNNLANSCWSYNSGNWWESPTIYFPNTMESAAEAFAQGAYWNTMEFDFDGGDMLLGLKNELWTQDNWCIFDNFKLEYYDEIKLITALSVTPKDTLVVAGETVQAVVSYTPEDATFRKLTFSSNNTNVATVDENGLISTFNQGIARITIRTTDGSNVSTYLTVRVKRNEPTAESVVINEIMASNIDQFISPAYNFDGWVELYNPTNLAVEISGIYLSNKANIPRMWATPSDMGVIPPHGYRIIWFDSCELNHKNCSFKLDIEGGSIFIADRNGKNIASQDYPEGIGRVSYARKTDGGNEWGLTSMPTPGASNNTATYAEQMLNAPVVDQPSQLFNGRVVANVTIPAGCTLRYTTDGTLPTLTNGSTSKTGQFIIENTQTYRFRLFADDCLASPVTSRSYILRDKDYTLPVISVISDPDFLYNDTIGVYVKGTNGRPGNGQSTACNWNMDWERPVNFSYITADGEMVLNQDVDLEMCGGWSRAWTPHSFKLKGSKELSGDNKLVYPFFKAKPYIRNRTLQIRNGGNNNNDRLKDGAIQTIVLSSGMDVDGQSYQPTHEFINGQYIGVLNMREPNNKHYVYANYGWSDDEIDQFEVTPDSFYVQKCGTDDAYKQLLALTADAANPETYEEIRKLLDVDEYINYMAVEFYLGSSDWMRNNVKAFRLHNDGKFRFVIFDTDGSFSYTNGMFSYIMRMEYNYTFDTLYPSGNTITTDNTLVTIFRQLLKNDSFRRQFIDTYCIVGGSVFEAQRCTQIIDSLVAVSQPAMDLEGRGWNVYNMGESLKNTFNGRNSAMISELRSYGSFNLSGVPAQKVTLQSNVPGARITLNDVEVPTGYFNGNLFAPVNIKAIAPGGYVFEGWTQGTGASSNIFDYGSEWLYYDSGSLDGKSWMSSTYSGNWYSSRAPFGYGKDNVWTWLDYGNNSSSKYMTYYFRKPFTLNSEPAAGDEFTLDFTVDDGFIVYINGTEAGRYNMPSGKANFNTASTTYAQGNPDHSSITLPANLFRKGNNVIAVEVHNNSGTSSDIFWDAALSMKSNTPTDIDFYSTESSISLPSGTVQLTAVYRPMTEAEQQEAHMTPVCINEISGANEVFINEYAKKSDWVELYNNTDKEIDIEGMYLSDNVSKPEKYRITKESTNANTIIAPHSYLLIWCDKLETTNQALHASFKIAEEGGQLLLTAADKSWTDTLYYGAHDGNSAVGRYPDGAPDVYTMTTPTIEKANILNSYCMKADQTVLDIRNAFVASANGSRIRYGGGMLLLRSEDAASAAITIYTASGQLMERARVALHGEQATLDVSHLPSGFYVARATTDDGTQVACKFMR